MGRLQSCWHREIYLEGGRNIKQHTNSLMWRRVRSAGRRNVCIRLCVLWLRWKSENHVHKRLKVNLLQRLVVKSKVDTPFIQLFMLLYKFINIKRHLPILIIRPSLLHSGTPSFALSLSPNPNYSYLSQLEVTSPKTLSGFAKVSTHKLPYICGHHVIHYVSMKKFDMRSYGATHLTLKEYPTYGLQYVPLDWNFLNPIWDGLLSYISCHEKCISSSLDIDVRLESISAIM